MTGRAPIASAVVAGSGMPALLCAMALKRALPSCAVTVLADPAADAGAGLADLIAWGGPALLRLHERIGIDERDMLVHVGASHRVGCHVAGWGKPALLCDGAALDGPLQGVRDLVTVAQALVAAERFADGADHPSGELSDLDFGMRFNRPAYLQMLSVLAHRLGIRRAAARIAGVAAGAGGRIAALTLDDGRSLTADLFVDTARGAPLSTALGRTRIDWSDAFVADRLVVRQTARPLLSLCDRLVADPLGWILHMPGRDGVTAIEARRGEGPPGDAGDVFMLAPGRLAVLAAGNLVAIGDAASEIAPIGDSPLSLVALQIMLLLDLLPGGDAHPLEMAELDRRLCRQADRMADHAAAFLAGTAPAAGAFWGAARHVRRSDDLARTLDGYARRGRIAFFEDDPHDRAHWLQLLALLCPGAAQPPPIASLPAAAVEAARRNQQARVARALALARPYPDWLSARLPRQA